MSNLRDAARQALEALEEATNYTGCEAWSPSMTDECLAVAVALRAALEQPEQEPVAWGDLAKEAEEIVRSKWVFKKWIDGTPLENDIAVWMADFAIEHTHPPRREWRGLTEEDIWTLAANCLDSVLGRLHFARAIEAALKERNHE